MVLLSLMAQCRAGQHDKCPKIEAAAPGEFGGVICDCECHYPKPVDKPASGDYREKMELEFWLAIRNGSDPDDFELYLSQFPNGAHVAQARERLAKLKSTG